MARQIAITIIATLLTIAGVLVVHRQYIAPSPQPILITESDAKSEPVAALGEFFGLPQNNGRDSDSDGLADELERVYGTDVNNSDTDGDGYPDGLEIKNNYNPRGSGRLPTYQIAQEPVKPPAPRVEPGGSIKEANMVYIDSLHIKVPLVYVVEVDEKAFQNGLINGVVHYPGTAQPGEAGNVFIFGHSSDYLWSKGNYKTIFAPLPNIKLGADIVVTSEAGQPYIYRVINTVVAQVRDMQYLDQYGRQKKLLTLQTSYPVGTAKQRFIVLAELVE